MKKLRTGLLALAFGALSTISFAQEQEARVTTITGSIVRYTPGQTIVIQTSNGKTVTYSIGSVPDVPAELPIGQRVTISTEPASDGSGQALVTRIEKTSIDAQGQLKTTTERTEKAPSGMSKTTQTTVYGTVTAIAPGQSITIERPTHEVVTYTIDAQSQLPQDIAVGKTVTVNTTTTTTQSSQPVVRNITYKTVTKTTRSKTVKSGQ